MTIAEILPDLFFIERGYLNANHFAFRGDAPVLIDTGYIGHLEETCRLLGRLGLKPADVGRIVTTHCHCDHIGGHHHIQQLSGCDILLHPLGRHFIETGDDWSTWWRYYHQRAAFFDCSKGVEDGDTVEIGPHRFDVLHTPGHAADGIVLYHPGEQILISSDTLWEHDMAVHTVRVEGSAAVYHTRQSLLRLQDLTVKTVYPGHGPWFTDFEGALDRSLQRVEKFLADRSAVGNDVVKKITVYHLLMHQQMAVDAFFDFLMQTRWFPETVDFYFEGEYRRKYDEIVGGLLDRGIIARKGKYYTTTVKP